MLLFFSAFTDASFSGVISLLESLSILELLVVVLDSVMQVCCFRVVLLYIFFLYYCGVLHHLLVLISIGLFVLVLVCGFLCRRKIVVVLYSFIIRYACIRLRFLIKYIVVVRFANRYDFIVALIFFLFLFIYFF